MTASVVDVGAAYAPYTVHGTQAGQYRRLTASGAIKAGAGQLIGFYVASTTAGTVILYDSLTGSGTQITGLITPAINFSWIPAIFYTGCYAVIGGTADITFVYL